MLNILEHIPLVDLLAGPGLHRVGQLPTLPVADSLERPLRDLRISVTDRCNFRCVYCMPRSVFGRDHVFLPSSSLLSFEEIERVARAFVSLGVEKIRLTGGEPLLRKNIEFLIERLAKLRTQGGKGVEIALTTNGSLLARRARALRDAGLTRVTVSLDALDDRLFQQMNDAEFPVSDVLNGIEAALGAGLGPVKINMVVKRGSNDQEILPMARHFRSSGVLLRFIEYMDVGGSNGWNMSEVLPSDQIVELISNEYPLMPIAPTTEGETAQRWSYMDGCGEVGFISSVTNAFCGSCSRARLSAEGRLYLCLFANSGHDLRPILSSGASQLGLTSSIAHIWRQRSDRYSELRERTCSAPALGGSPRIEMSYVGG